MTIFLVDLSLKLCLLEIARPLCLVNLKWVNDRASLTIEEPKFIQEDWDVFCNLSEEKADDRSSTSDKQLTVLSESKVEVAGVDLDAVTETPLRHGMYSTLRRSHTVIGRPFSVPSVHRKAPEVQILLLPAQKDQVRRRLSMQRMQEIQSSGLLSAFHR